MATLGNIKWGVQYVMGYGDVTSTKTINGLNLDESASSGADESNATKVNHLVGLLADLSRNTLRSVSLVETRPVED